MKRYYRIYELHNGEAIYFNFDLEPCDRKDAYLWSGKPVEWMTEPPVVIEWCEEDEQMRLNNQPVLFEVNQ